MFLYVNFSDVSKQNNGGKDIKINGSVANPSIGDKEVDTDGDGLSDLEELGTEITTLAYNPSTRKYESYKTWTFYSNPAKADTDGDGIPDSKDEEKCKFDITADTSNERFIVFNNGKIWHNIGSVLSEFFSAISLNGKSDNENDRKFSQEELKEAVDKVDKNSEQDFGIEELIAIAVYDSEGCRYYTDDLSKAFRERLFKEVTDRDCRYYKHSGILSSSNWKEVPYGTEGGFWKGAVITEADANYSTGANCVFDIYMFIDYAIVVGEILIISLIVMDFAPIVVANMKALAFYIKTFGVKEGIKTFLVLGAANAPNVTNGLVSYLQMDMADGDSSLDDFVEKGGKTTGLAQYGDDFGKMGTYVKNPNIKVDWSQYSEHGFERMQQRGMTQGMVDQIVANGKVLLQNNGSKFAFITQDGVAVVSKGGKLITTWSSEYYDSAMHEIIIKLFGE